MRPHNGWWRASSTPRRWIDLVQEGPQLVNKQVAEVQPVKPVVVTEKTAGVASN